jgi:hypothetical protein
MICKKASNERNLSESQKEELKIEEHNFQAPFINIESMTFQQRFKKSQTS